MREILMSVRIPMPLFTKHEGQAWKNHGQSLNQLAERGGIDFSEAVAILEDRPWSIMDQTQAMKRLLELLSAELQ